ncbi:MAG: hypothetical protein V5A37_08040, partial [Halobacteriales archaeon]
GVATLLHVAAVGATLFGSATVPGGGPPGDAPATETPGPPAVVEDVAVAGDRTVVTYATRGGEPRTFAVEGVAPDRVDPAADWAYVPRSALPPALAAAAGNYDAGVGVVGPWALVGDLAAASRENGAARTTVVAPTGGDVDPQKKANVLARFLAPYSLQPGPDDRVTLFVAPPSLSADGLWFGDAGYVTQQGFWDGDVASVWIHEYVHGQQSFATAPAMAWFVEASATYLSYRVMAAQYGRVSEADVLDRLAAVPEYDVALANRSGWDDRQVAYHRGARLLYLVDAAVRNGSDGAHTLVDVFRAMNAHEGPITVEAFVALVERYAGEPQGWLREAIVGTGRFDDRVADASDAFADRGVAQIGEFSVPK